MSSCVTYVLYMYVHIERVYMNCVQHVCGAFVPEPVHIHTKTCCTCAASHVDVHVLNIFYFFIFIIHVHNVENSKFIKQQPLCLSSWYM
jgi:hypothetical protein